MPAHNDRWMRYYVKLFHTDREKSRRMIVNVKIWFGIDNIWMWRFLRLHPYTDFIIGFYNLYFCLFWVKYLVKKYFIVKQDLLNYYILAECWICLEDIAY